MTNAELARASHLWSQGHNTLEIAHLMSQGREKVPECVIYNLIHGIKNPTVASNPGASSLTVANCAVEQSRRSFIPPQV